MSPLLRLEIFHQGELIHAAELARPVDLGRQENAQERLFASQPGLSGDRIAFAPIEQNTISRRHVRIEPLSDARARIINLNSKRALELADGAVAPEGSREVALPYHLALVGYRIDLLPLMSAGSRHFPPQPPSADTDSHDDESLRSIDLASLGPGQSESIISWLQAITTLLQSAAHSQDFFERAAKAIVDLAGLDSGRVLLYEAGRWREVARHAAPLALARAAAHEPSMRMLEKMREKKQTKTRRGAKMTDLRGSLTDIEAVIATPILDGRGETIGALYGDRLQNVGSSSPPRITRADVLLLETMAGGVGAGLARLEQEQAALAARVRFEQFFTPDLARQLADDPNLLIGRDTEVTLLFCDIRGFSAVAEKLGAAGTMQWINDVLGTLSDCVLKHHGVLVDYTGDELFAMWGAPVEQPDHAELACRTAIDMWQVLPEVSQRWREKIGGETRVGIGVNSGLAHVGNTGSARKFKYGALGNAVNLSSRVQGATKYLRSGVLITEHTQRCLPESIATRRLCSVHVVNIAEPVMLYELQPAPEATWPDLRQRYEEALAEFERQHFNRAMILLCELLTHYPGDGPSLVLLARLVPLLDHPAQFSPVWELPGK
ncbi:MAG TPA: adenylate/guanylate cyclase domain-containing protein [Pirellulales bacterium]